MIAYYPAIPQGRPRSPFASAAAVDAWDAWFRWRDASGLRDVTIDDTWSRVAVALVGVRREGIDAAADVERYRCAFSEWRLLPDPVLLRSLGTDARPLRDSDLAAVVNVSACIHAPVTAHASLDESIVAATTALAVRLLDDAIECVDGSRRSAAAVSIDVIGAGDAIAMLGLRYDSEAGRALAARLGGIVANAAFEAAVALAEERGSRTAFDPARVPVRCPAAVLRRARRTGLRFTPAIAARSHRELALFANAVSDALDPISDETHLHQIDSQHGGRRVAAAGPALLLRRERAATGAVLSPIDTAREVSADARRLLGDAFEAGAALTAERPSDGAGDAPAPGEHPERA